MFVALGSLALGSAVAAVRTGDASMVLPVDQLAFYQNPQGLTVANAWGDPATGPHSNYIKMPGGAASGLHTHSFSYYGVVIAGIVANEPSDGVPARPLKPGSYWFQKGGEPHVTNCLSATECLIFVTSKGPFDFKPVKVGQGVPPPRAAGVER